MFGKGTCKIKKLCLCINEDLPSKICSELFYKTLTNSFEPSVTMSDRKFIIVSPPLLCFSIENGWNLNRHDCLFHLMEKICQALTKETTTSILYSLLSLELVIPLIVQEQLGIHGQGVQLSQGAKGSIINYANSIYT